MKNKNRKGIILAGGSGSRLSPLTKIISKQLLPIFNKPMIFYPLSVLMLSGIKEILIITDEKNFNLYKELLGDGSRYGLNLSYKIQKKPNGIAEAFIIGEDFINGNPVALILGDNIFFGNNFANVLKKINNDIKSSHIFLYHLSNPKDFGVAKLDKSNNVIKIIEKPKKLISSYAGTGLYFYNSDICNIAKKLKPSDRGELEITDLNNLYIKKNKLKAHFLGRGFSWYDTGTFENLLEASINIRNLETRQDIRIGLIDEISYNNNWISKKQLLNNLDFYSKTEKDYLKKIIN